MTDFGRAESVASSTLTHDEQVVARERSSSNSHTTDDQHDDIELPNNHDMLHSFVMVLLYLSQGVVFGVNNSLVTLLQATGREVSLSDQSLLSLPAYAFALKFLWSPFVDSCYFTKRNRRPLWIITCQFAATAGIIIVRAMWSQLSQHVGVLSAVMSVLLFAIATQDIAVDAFAVEGVSSSRAALAASAQSIGLLTGFVVTKSFFVLQDYGIVSVEGSAEGLLTMALVLEVGVTLSFLIYLPTQTCSTALSAAMNKELHVLKEKRRDREMARAAEAANNKNGNDNDHHQDEEIHVVGEDSTYEAVLGVVADMREFASQPFFVDVLLVLTLRGIAWAGMTMVQTAQQRHFGITAAFSSKIYLVLLPVQFFVSSFAPSVVRFLQSTLKLSILEVWFACGTLTLAVAVADWAVFSLFAPSMAAESSSNGLLEFFFGSTTQYRCWVAFIALISTFLSTFEFNASSTFASSIAAKIPHSTGTAMTVIFSLMNLGYQVWRSLALFVAGQLSSTTTANEGSGNMNSTESASSTGGSSGGQPLHVVNTVLWVFVAVGIFVRFAVVLPSVFKVKRLLQADADNEDAKNVKRRAFEAEKANNKKKQQQQQQQSPQRSSSKHKKEN